MSVELPTSFDVLERELNQAKTSLEEYDSHIKRLVGRTNQQTSKAAGANGVKGRKRAHDKKESAAVPAKRKPESVFSRLDKTPPSNNNNESDLRNKLHSRVIVTNREVPSRSEALKAQSSDVVSTQRNRRMFGALLGTLQKFKQEETKLKQTVEKRAQVEKKVEEQAILEKEKIKAERAELFRNRRKKQQEIRILEEKLSRIKDANEWEVKQKQLCNFIQTTAKPRIFYLPKKLDKVSTERLEETRREITDKIEKKKVDLAEELKALEIQVTEYKNSNGSKTTEPDDRSTRELMSVVRVRKPSSSSSSSDSEDLNDKRYKTEKSPELPSKKQTLMSSVVVKQEPVESTKKIEQEKTHVDDKEHVQKTDTPSQINHVEVENKITANGNDVDGSEIVNEEDIDGESLTIKSEKSETNRVANKDSNPSEPVKSVDDRENCKVDDMN